MSVSETPSEFLTIITAQRLLRGNSVLICVYSIIDTVRLRIGFLQQLLMLEATLLFGGMGLHDQHSDLRLDVDNMSYEV